MKKYQLSKIGVIFEQTNKSLKNFVIICNVEKIKSKKGGFLEVFHVGKIWQHLKFKCCKLFATFGNIHIK